MINPGHSKSACADVALQAAWAVAVISLKMVAFPRPKPAGRPPRVTASDTAYVSAHLAGAPPSFVGIVRDGPRARFPTPPRCPKCIRARSDGPQRTSAVGTGCRVCGTGGSAGKPDSSSRTRGRASTGAVRVSPVPWRPASEVRRVGATVRSRVFPVDRADIRCERW
jgi:hypothetical protein